jgi:methionine-rich copper-binding protein CopC
MLISLAPVGAVLLPAGASAQDVRVLESTPAANGTIDGRTSAFSVHFDRPIDHVRSLLIIRQGSEVVETLHPRLQSAPQVLFARAPTLPPGKYTLHWQVITPTDVKTAEGDIPFTVVSDN